MLLQDLRQRLADELPGPCQQHQHSPYLDRSLYLYDDRFISSSMRSHHPPHRCQQQKVLARVGGEGGGEVLVRRDRGQQPCGQSGTLNACLTLLRVKLRWPEAEGASFLWFTLAQRERFPPWNPVYRAIKFMCCCQPEQLRFKLEAQDITQNLPGAGQLSRRMREGYPRFLRLHCLTCLLLVVMDLIAHPLHLAYAGACRACMPGCLAPTELASDRARISLHAQVFSQAYLLSLPAQAAGGVEQAVLPTRCHTCSTPSSPFCWRWCKTWRQGSQRGPRPSPAWHKSQAQGVRARHNQARVRLPVALFLGPTLCKE